MQKIHPVFSDSLFVKVRITKSEFFSAWKQGGKKEPDNEYDEDAIQVLLPVYGKIGYIANSPYTVAKGTLSAGRAYDQVKKKFYVRVLYICTNQIICRVEEGRKEDLENRIIRQLRVLDNTEF